jgi:hypothetical protein
MKRALLVSVAALALCLTAVSAMAGEEKPVDEQAMMKAWMEAATPGAQHKLLEPMVGVWNVVNYSYETGQKVEAGGGTSTRTMILGDRFLQDHTEAQMMGMPMDGWGLTGYNNTTGEYESTWIDNMGTAIYLSKGKATADGKQITQTMDYVDPMTKKATKVKTILSFDGPDNASFTWYSLEGDKETKSMEMIYTRRK